MRKVYTGSFNPMMRMQWMDEIKDALFILPTRHLLHKTRKQFIAKTGGAINLKLVTFDDIAKQILQKDRILYKDLTLYDRRRIINGILLEEKDHLLLQPYREVIDSSGFIHTIMGQLGDWKREGATEQEAEKIVQQQSMDEKERLLAYLYLKYQQRLKSTEIYWMDPEERIIVASQQLEKAARHGHPYLMGIKTVYMDHFTDLTPLQLNLLLVLLKQVADVKIYLPYEEKMYEYFPNLRKGMENTLRKLEEIGIETEKVGFLDQTVHPEILHLQKHALRRTREKCPEPTRIEVLSACEIKREVEIAAKECKRILNDGNGTVAPEDIAIIIRNPKAYHDELHDAFAEEKIPLHFPRRISIIEVPLVRAIFSLLEVFAEDWSRGAILKTAASSYLTWKNPPSTGLEKWAMEHGITQGRKQWFTRLERSSQSIKEQLSKQKNIYLEKRLQQLTLLQQWLEELDQLFLHWPIETTAITWSQYIHTAISYFDWRSTFQEFMKSDLYSTSDWKRDIDALKTLLSSIKEMRAHAELIGDTEKLSIQDFVREWKIALSELEVIAEQGQGNGVLVLDPSSARGDRFHTVFILGLNEGSFPRTSRESWWSKKRLEEQKEMELLFFHMTLGIVKERLILSHLSPAANDRMLRSPLLDWVLDHYEGEAWKHPPHFREAMHSGYRPSESGISNRRELRKLQLSNGECLLGEETNRYHRILHGIHQEKVRLLGAYSKWDGNLEDSRIHHRITEMYHQDRPYSVSFINEYASSPLRFYFQRVLGVRPMEELEQEITSREQGDLLHKVLQRFYTQYKGKKMSGEPIDVVKQTLTQIFTQVTEEWQAERIYIEQYRWQLDKVILLRDLLDWLEHEYNHKYGPEIHPTQFEFSFGLPMDGDMDEESRPDPILLTWEGGQLLLYGKMDRIDVGRDGSFIIYDYKLSTTSYKGYKDIVEQRNFQLPLYLLAYGKHLEEKSMPATPYGACFYSLRTSEKFIRKGIWSKEHSSHIGLHHMTAGQLGNLSAELNSILVNVGQLLEEMRTGNFYMIPRHTLDKYYGDRALYRMDKGEINRKAMIVKSLWKGEVNQS